MTATQTAEPETTERNRIAAPEPATADSAEGVSTAPHQRIQLAVNVGVWRGLPDDQVEMLTWFHQYMLDQGMSEADGAEAIGYSVSTVNRILRNKYDGNMAEICGAIASYRRIAAERALVQKSEFVQTSTTKLIWGALTYALAGNTVVCIEGESRSGKTMAATSWRDANNHGRSVYVIAPAYGGTKALLRAIVVAIGANKESNAGQMHDACIRAFNRHRILIVDEAHRLLPNERRSGATNLEILRDLHDRTGCGLAFIATCRFHSELTKSEYMYEQLLGRIDLPLRIPSTVKRSDVEAIVRQYMAAPSGTTLDIAERISNQRGRLGMLTGTLRLASRMSGGHKGRVTNEHFAKALAFRKKMMGDTESTGRAEIA